jgi:lysophospholipase
MDIDLSFLSLGFIQDFDERDVNLPTSGLFQCPTYQAGLSGGAWLLSSMAGNDYPTISSLQRGHMGVGFPVIEVSIVKDLLTRKLAGFEPTLTDPCGRLLSY